MNSTRIAFSLAALWIASLFAPHPTFSQIDCGQILEHGVFDITTTDSLKIRTETFVNWLSQSSFDSYKKAMDSGGALGIPIEDIPVQISGFLKFSDWHDYQSAMQKLDFSDEKNLEAFKQVVINADQGLVNAWTTCILNNKGAAHAAIEVNSDPKQFVVHLSYTPNGPPPAAKITDFAIQPSTVTCREKIYTSWFWHTYIESQGMILNCTRQSQTDAVQITGNTMKGPITAKLPGIALVNLAGPSIIDLPKEATGKCSQNTFPPPRGKAIDNGYSIDYQEVWHIKCPAGGKVLSANYISCAFSDGRPCSHINPRPELTGPCDDDPKAACITFQTNNGDFKIVTGTYTYIPDAPSQK